MVLSLTVEIAASVVIIFISFFLLALSVVLRHKQLRYASFEAIIDAYSLVNKSVWIVTSVLHIIVVATSYVLRVFYS